MLARQQNDETAPFQSAFADSPMSDLPPLEAHLIGWMRVWAKGVRARVCPLRLLAPRLVMRGRLDCLVPLHKFMLTLAESAARTIDMSDNELAALSRDETHLLQALCEIYRGSVAQARQHLLVFIRHDQLGAVIHEGMVLGGVMNNWEPIRLAGCKTSM